MAGYGEGGLLALYAASLDTRIESTLVSGYFQPREELWKEPIYRDVWGLLRRVRRRGIGGMIAPRKLIVEASRAPEIAGPPPAHPSGRGAAPVGAIVTPRWTRFAKRCRKHDQRLHPSKRRTTFSLIASGDGQGLPDRGKR